MSLYEQNLQVLSHFNPELMTQLFAIQGNENYEVFVDEKDPLKINLLHVKTNQVMYSTDPLEETLFKHDDFEKKYSRYPMLYFYGIGNGVLLKLLLQNELHHRIVVIEPELELLYIAFNLNDFQKEMREARILFYSADQIDLPRGIELFSHKDAKVFAKTYHLEIMQPFYEFNFGENILTCNRVFAQAIEHVIVGLGNDATDALIGLEHHLANVDKMIETVTVQELIQHAKTTDTAIIVSTGPSLKKQLPLLKKIKDHITIFCVDASFPILEKEGIKPDVVLTMERVYETAKFYQETSKAFHEDVIFAITSIAHPMLFESIKAGTLQMSMRPFGYTRYFDLDEYGYVGIGMSAANLAFEYIYHSNFKTCILIGQDLAYAPDGASHSDGHLFGVNDKKQRYDDLFVGAYGGEGSVRTTKIWNMFKNFFENDVYATAKNGLQTINATEGGARINGTIEMSFQEACDQYVDMHHVKQSIKVKKPDSTTIEANRTKTQTRINEMKAFANSIYKEVETLFLDVVHSCESLQELDAYHNLEKVNYDELGALMQRIDVFKDHFNDDTFISIFIDATQATIMHQELELAKIQVRPIENDDDKRRKMIDWIFAHQQWLFSLAGLIQAVKVAIERQGANSYLWHKMYFNDTSIHCYFRNLHDDKEEYELVLEIDEHEVDRQWTNAQIADFVLPSIYFDNKNHVIAIREKEGNTLLKGAPVHEVLLSEYRSELEFYESLSGENANLKKQKDPLCQIGVFVDELFLSDNQFMSYIDSTAKKHEKLRINFFYFNTSYLAKLKKYFPLENEKFRFNELNSIQKVIKHVDIWFSRSLKQRIEVESVIREQGKELLFVLYNEMSKQYSIVDWENRYGLNEWIDDKGQTVKITGGLCQYMNDCAKELDHYEAIEKNNTFYEFFYLKFMDYLIESEQYRQKMIRIFYENR